MTNPAQIADRYIAVWNETDQVRREELLVEGWAESATYVDPMMAAEGREAIGRADGYQDKVRFSWTLGPEAEADMIKGTDFIVVEGGRLKSITGFLDRVPVGA